MARARAHLVNPSVTRWYHCITGCVQSAFHLGVGPGDRKISNNKPSATAIENSIEGAQYDGGVLKPIPVPISYQLVPPSTPVCDGRI
ncbi:MAG: hypothetical protein ACLQIB_25580 [Isosphaeraceae bacterium]